MKKILLIDNYDSFTYNLVELVRQCCTKENLNFIIDVKRNDCFDLKEVSGYDKIIFSPGPGLPSEAGLMPEVVKNYYTTKPILGICLGHQCIGEVFGGELENMSKVMHGKGENTIIINQEFYIFKDLPNNFKTGRYHSWVVTKNNFPDCLEIIAEDDAGFIMALRHRDFDVVGLQFHPESVLTPSGTLLMTNWLKNE